MQDANRLTFALRLAIGPGVASPFLSDLLAQQRAEEPAVELTIHETTAEELLQGVMGGRYDIGIALTRSDTPSIRSEPLWIEEIGAAMPLHSPLLGCRPLTLKDLRGCPLYRWQAEQCPELDQMLLALQQRTDQEVRQLASLEMIALWVGAGYGIGLVRQSQAPRAHSWGTVMLPLSGGPYRVTTYLVQRAKKASPIGTRFEERAIQLARNRPDAFS
ncbi:LysR family substrate-binding domain-containing protein [Xanthomonas citri]|uniref:LysR family substrate-binding domain-containing protein n=1 Tax=Xanthomonas citri TaxID=346 RepID=UPI001884BE2A|nr:LysR family substrate-binding domain-containing protein [Xanthomonas citri]QQK67999.1 LysR family substrate-binding domain-containing protein [Xanthomonas citri]